MKKPFDEVSKPTKTAKRIMQTQDGEGCQLLSEEEKKKLDTAKKFEQLGPLQFSDDEDDELSLETITSNKSKGLNKSQGTQTSVTKPEVEQPNDLVPRAIANQVKEGETTPFHQDAFEMAGGMTAPDAKGSSAGGWTVQGSGSRQQSVCHHLTPKGIGNMLRLHNPTPPQTNSDSGSAGSDKSNRFAALQEEDKEEDSHATTAVLPMGEIPETIQEGAVLTQADSNEVQDNIQVEVAEPEVDGDNVPQENDPQPDGIASSKEADFFKAESRPMIHMKTQKGSPGHQILPRKTSWWCLQTQRISIPMTSWNATLAKLLQASPRRIGNPNVDLTRHMHPNMLSSEAREAHWWTKERMVACWEMMPRSSSSATRQQMLQALTTMNLLVIHFRWSAQPQRPLQTKDLLSSFFGTAPVMVSIGHCIQLDKSNGFRTKHMTLL